MSFRGFKIQSELSRTDPSCGFFGGPDLDLEALRVPRRQQRLISGSNALEDSQCNSEHGKVCNPASPEWLVWDVLSDLLG